MQTSFRNQSVDNSRFAMIPDAQIPRATFKRDSSYKTAFDAGFLIPIYVEEALPGDTVSLDATCFGRLATPIFPVMDNVYLDTFFFFVPNRLLWSNWKKFMGEQANPGDSISFVIPQLNSGTGGFLVGSVFDYFGLPTVGQVAGLNTVSVSALPLRAYNLIYNEWFRDENLNISFTVPLTDGPDNISTYALCRRGKRKDYFTSALPWPQKGNTAVTLPLGTSAPVLGLFTASATNSVSTAGSSTINGAAAGTVSMSGAFVNAASKAAVGTIGSTAFNTTNSNVYADLSSATAATINQLRQSFAIQRLLERDARGGTRYTEIVRAHFGVVSPDARLQRPEYLGGGTSPIVVTPMQQTSATGVTGGSTPLGHLSGMGSFVSRNGFTYSCVEHGFIIGLASVRADLNYQQGLDRMWSRSTRYDFYFPAFANLGEQAILSKEIYCDGSANDNDVFGYQERWAEYRYGKSKITGLMRSTSAGTIDPWHLAQRFTTRPVLNDTFIYETPPLSRVLAVGAGANGQQILFDAVFSQNWTRPIPMFSVPGLSDRF